MVFYRMWIDLIPCFSYLTSGSRTDGSAGTALLECVYETLQDAGYTRQSLGAIQGQGMAGNVGVFVGVMYEEYQLYGAQEQLMAGRWQSMAMQPL